jgi:hypothetical protein
VVERDFEGGGQGGEVRVVGDDEGDFNFELICRGAEEEIIQAVSDFRHHDEYAWFLVC